MTNSGVFRCQLTLFLKLFESFDKKTEEQEEVQLKEDKARCELSKASYLQMEFQFLSHPLLALGLLNKHHWTIKCFIYLYICT